MFKASAIVIGLALAAAVPASAQNSCSGSGSCTATATATVAVPVLVSLQVGNSGTITLTAPDGAALTAGQVDDNGPAITVKANRSWTLTLATSSGANWSYTGTDGGVKPISDFLWSTDNSTFTAISGTAATIATGVKTNSATPTLYFRTLYPNDYSDARVAAGSYSIGLTFTLTAP